MKKSGIIISIRDDQNQHFSEIDENCWHFLPVDSECSHCSSCSYPERGIPIVASLQGGVSELNRVADRPKIDAVIGIRSRDTSSVLIHTLLLPLMGFTLGAAAGMMLFESDLASVFLSACGMIGGILASRPLDYNVLEISTNIS
jgi:hypothetical protein